MEGNIKIIIIGFGSIGRRHYKNFLKLGFKNISVYDIDEKKTAGESFQRLARLEKETLERFDIAFICNPTNLHTETAIKCAEAGCHLFIEKPLSHTLEHIEKLIKICKDRGVISMVGCNMRFVPAIKKIKDLLEDKFIGKIYAIYSEYGRYLPYQRPGVDYRNVYAANRKMGGGIKLDDVHSFDLLFWLNNFSEAERFVCISDKISDLESDAEDISNAVIKFKNKVIGNIRSDYLQQYKHRNLKVIGERGNLVWEFRESAVWFEHVDGGQERRDKIFETDNYDSDNQYIEELKYFLTCVENKTQTFNGIEHASKVIKLLMSENELDRLKK